MQILMKFKFTVFFLLFLAITINEMQAENILVWLSSGEKVIYNLGDNPKITPSDKEIIIETAKAKVTYTQGQVKKITFDEKNDNIESINGSLENAKINDKTIELSGFKSNENVIIYDLSGKTIFSQPTASDGCLIINLSNFNKGVYIIKVKNYTSKFIIK